MNFELYYLVIWVTAFLTAIVSAVAGMVGGTLLLAVMAQYLKLEVLIPLHGIVQLSSNSSRTWFLRDAVNFKISTENIFGVVVGSLVASQYVVRINEAYYSLVLGLFILFITHVPKFKAPLNFKGKWAALGFVASFLGLFVGSVGVLVGSVFLAEKMEKRELIATQAFCQAGLHLAKVVVFFFLGFAIQPWLSLLAGTLLMTSLGSWVGTRILDKIPEKRFRQLLTLVISVLALRLVVLGLTKAAH